jgi:hypothetical protein
LELIDRLSILAKVNPPRSFSPRNMDLAVNQLLLRQLIFQWLILSEIPDHYRTGSVLAGRNHALELCIFERMVLGPYGEALARWFIEGLLGAAQDTRTPFTASRKS